MEKEKNGKSRFYRLEFVCGTHFFRCLPNNAWRYDTYLSLSNVQTEEEDEDDDDEEEYQSQQE